MKTLFFLLLQTSQRCLKHVLHRGLPCCPTPAIVLPVLLVPSKGAPAACAPQRWSHCSLLRVKASCKCIWRCSDPSPSTDQSCQACWPARDTALTTQPALDPSWLAPSQPSMGKSCVREAWKKTREIHLGQRALLSPCPHSPVQGSLGAPPRKKTHLIIFHRSCRV